MFSESGFQEAQKKSHFIHQYKCKCSPKRWWGSNSNNVCNKCNATNKHLDLKNTIGIGWFKCLCGRVYAGFSRGDVTSKCHVCDIENYPVFIVSGDKANKNEKTEKAHYCSMCKGNGECPIVAQVQNTARQPRRQIKIFNERRKK